ncbi:DUF4381 domain-containing protein [Gammaproteobacteria bacterium LSUCC0112]|nr:DUF4381 domain-containing protein [Gammaproteobacteria bacterium LSUCC0112]
MDIADALSELADIHMPGEVSYWPLAAGWWVLAALLLALAIYGAWRLQKRLTLQKRLNAATSELANARQLLKAAGESDMANRLVFVNNVNAVLRRVALLHLEHKAVAGLSGQAWVSLLRQHDKAGLLDAELAQVLAQGRFAPRCDVDADALERMAREWIKNLYLAKLDTASTTEPHKNKTSAAADNHA